jgi:hypothetical protein
VAAAGDLSHSDLFFQFAVPAHARHFAFKKLQVLSGYWMNTIIRKG